MNGPKNKSKSQSELVFLPLGGIGEIGMNTYLYGYGQKENRKWLMVDLGMTFPSEREPGVDVIFPDLTFIEEERKDLCGLLITHAHEDHFGALIDLWPRLEVPVYTTPFTAGLISAKMEEYGLVEKMELNIIQQGERFNIGPFDLELVSMAHSVPESNGVIIRSPEGVIFHTGDWKLDAQPVVGLPTDEDKLAKLGIEGVDVLICDSTNALSEGFSQSEGEVAKTFIDLFKKAENRVAVTSFSSNVARIKSIAEAAKASDRHLVVIGRALLRVIQVAKETGHLPQDMEVLSEEEYGYLPREKVVALCTGSQGEPRAAMSRIASDEHPQITLTKGDTVIFSSKTIPGNEKFVAYVQNNLAAQGLEVITDRDALVHVSGHPRKGELQKLYDWVKPKAVIPMHGEEMHLHAHERFARKMGVENVVQARNGHIVRLLPGKAEIIDEAPVGRLFRDGDLIITEEDPSVRERRKLAFTGVICISAALKKTGEIIGDPQVQLVGIPEDDGEGSLLVEIVQEEVIGVLESIPRARRKDIDMVTEAMRRGARSAIRNVWDKKPVCVVMVNIV